MPELPEVEAYRVLAQRALDRAIAVVDTSDSWFLRSTDPALVARTLVGERFTDARRRGKLLLLDVSNGATLGLRFGMTGRLLVDGVAGVDRLLYTSEREEPRWDRFAVHFVDGGALVVRDPRRLGRVELDPDEDALGPDALDLDAASLSAALEGSDVALKARLMDQERIAGIGNLVADEVLWRAGLAPDRPARSLTAEEIEALALHVRTTLADLGGRGGSHLGDVAPARTPGGVCPRDGTPLRRARVGGRTTYWCPTHQR